MLGTNDLNKRFSLSAYDIANGAGVLVDIVQKSALGRDGSAPPPTTTLTDFGEMFEGAASKSQRFSLSYQRVADEKGCHFLDTREIVVSSPMDGIHLEAAEHAKLDRAVAKAVRNILG